MKKSELRKLIKSILKEQGAGPRPAPFSSNFGQMGIPGGGGKPGPNTSPANQMQSRKQIGGGSVQCICADGSRCNGRIDGSGTLVDCSCCRADCAAQTYSGGRG